MDSKENLFKLSTSFPIVSVFYPLESKHKTWLPLLALVLFGGLGQFQPSTRLSWQRERLLSLSLVGRKLSVTS
jgi:hypothetical protein